MPISPIPSPSGPQPLLWLPREAAEALQISERSLWDLAKRGQIPVVRLGRSVRYDPRDLATYIEKQKQNAVRV